MITIADIKSYLKITETTYDIVLQGFINNSIQEIETEIDRNLEYKTYTEYVTGNDNNIIYLKGYPIKSVTSVEYWNDESDDWDDLLEGEYTPAEAIDVHDDSIVVKYGYNFFSDEIPKNLKVVYVAGYKCETGTGTMSIAISTKAVTGVNTLFTTECTAGDVIQCEGQDFIIDTITNATGMTVKSNASATISGKAYVIKTVPNDLKRVMLEKTALTFMDSAQNKGRLGISSENVGSQAAQSYTFKEVNHDKILNKYKRYSL